LAAFVNFIPELLCMNKLLLTISIALVNILTIPLSSKSEKPGEYAIVGLATGYPDSTVFYLDNISNGAFIHMDSAYTMSGIFLFNGSLNVKVLHVVIRNSDFSDMRVFWLENTAISVKGEKGKFREAVVEGSKTQTEQDQLDSAIRVTNNEKGQSILFIHKHPASIVSAYVLDTYCALWGKDTSTVLYNSFSNEIKNTSYGKNVLEFITLNKNLKTGDRYVDFSEPNIYGKLIKLSDFNGKVVLLEFWASWCVPCRKGNPDLVKIYQEFKDKGFDILGVAAEMVKKEWIDAVQQDGLPWQNVTDFRLDKNKASLIYGVSSYPTNFLIDKNGTIVAKDITGDKLREKLRELLK
jgi:thiol-disulfide isomerase/thioredoxin